MTKESTSHQVNEKQSGNERQQLKQGPCWVNKYQPKYVGKVLVPSQHTVMCLFAKLLRFCFFYDPKGSLLFLFPGTNVSYEWPQYNSPLCFFSKSYCPSPHLSQKIRSDTAKACPSLTQTLPRLETSRPCSCCCAQHCCRYKRQLARKASQTSFLGGPANMHWNI